jgi:light-regulated signal transduction histidine kinase (bacteriophytochrome)
MSHELRTPLNSLLILSDQLSGNSDGNLTAKQVEFASTIHSSGNDLLMLINDILDLSKIESGTVAVDVSELMPRRAAALRRAHVPPRREDQEPVVRDPHGSAPAASRSSPTPSACSRILKNLLSNAFKFTHKGEVNLRRCAPAGGWSADNDDLTRATDVIEFSVTDTGIGIRRQAADHLRGVPAGRRHHQPQVRRHGPRARDQPRAVAAARRRRFKLASVPRAGSTFTLYLPLVYVPPRIVRKAERAVVDVIEASKNGRDARSRPSRRGPHGSSRAASRWSTRCRGTSSVTRRPGWSTRSATTAPACSRATRSC